MSQDSKTIQYVTTRIQCKLPSGETSTGTGLFFVFSDPKNPTRIYPLIITNKHVLSNAETIEFYINRADKNGNRFDGERRLISIPKRQHSKLVIPHPEDGVDLSAIVIGGTLSDLRYKGFEPFFKTLTPKFVPQLNDLKKFSSIEDVYVIGYPNGIWDDVHNNPIIRKGITATPLAYNYKDKPQFLIDAAIYPGSSGSPVLIFNEGSYSTSAGITLGTRMVFLGVVYAVYEHNVDGALEIKKVGDTKSKINLSIPNNLGIVISSSKILDFENLLVHK